MDDSRRLTRYAHNGDQTRSEANLIEARQATYLRLPWDQQIRIQQPLGDAKVAWVGQTSIGIVRKTDINHLWRGASHRWVTQFPMAKIRLFPPPSTDCPSRPEVGRPSIPTSISGLFKGIGLVYTKTKTCQMVIVLIEWESNKWRPQSTLILAPRGPKGPPWLPDTVDELTPSIHFKEERFQYGFRRSYFPPKNEIPFLSMCKVFIMGLTFFFHIFGTYPRQSVLRPRNR